MPAVSGMSVRSAGTGDCACPFRPALLLSLMLLCTLSCAVASAAEPLLLAHYMPWYATPASGGGWGWHWTMDHFNPERRSADGRREIASHDYPLIGPYDSGEDRTLECHALLMKLAGLDGVIIDWYGTGPTHDHPLIHRNMLQLLPWLRRAGLRFAICYEDQAVKSMSAENWSEQVGSDLRWAEKHLFSNPDYLRHDGRPLLLVFGPQLVRWNFTLDTRPLVLGLPHLFREHGLDGCFAWPPVDGGKTVTADQWRAALDAVYTDDRTLVATAFPGFKDVYSQAGVRKTYGSIDADGGRTFIDSLAQALKSGKPFIQIATWNDFGEGTVIEPTLGQGYRSLEALPRCGSKPRLRLPVQLHDLRKRGGSAARLDEASRLLFAADAAAAKGILDAVGRDLSAAESGQR